MGSASEGTATAATATVVAESRKRLIGDGLAISAYALPDGLVFGLTALQAHYSLADVLANSTIALAGGAPRPLPQPQHLSA